MLKHLEQAKTQSTMIRALLVASDKAIFQGVENNNIEWLISSYLNSDFKVDSEVDEAIENLKTTMRATLDAQEALDILINVRLGL